MWTDRWQYRLCAVPRLTLAGRTLQNLASIEFRAFSRQPVGATYTLPFVESPPAQNEALFFVHPSSLLSLRAWDRSPDSRLLRRGARRL